MKRILTYMKKTELNRLLLPLLFFGAWFKGMFLQCYFEGTNAYAPSAFADAGGFFSGLFFSFFTLLLFFSPALLFKKKGASIYAIVIAALTTAFCLIHAGYFRAFSEMFSFKLLSLASDAANEGYLSFSVIAGLLSPYDLLFLVDWLLLAALLLFRRFYRGAREEQRETAAKPAGKIGSFLKNVFSRRAVRFFSVFALCVLVLSFLPVMHLFGAMESAWAQVYDPPFNKGYALHFTPLGWECIDVIDTIREAASDPEPTVDPSASSTEPQSEANRPQPTETVIPSPELPAPTDKEKKQIEDFYAFRDSHLAACDLSGKYKGWNVLLLQVESLENCVLNQYFNGREITPYLNRLLSSSASTVVFTGLHDQVKSGNSSDCDLMINTGILPTSDIFFKKHLDKRPPNIPALLREDGYKTVHINGSGAKCVWDYKSAYRDVFGFNVDENDPDCEFFLLPAEKKDKINNYLSDEKILEFVYGKLEGLKGGQPFYMHTILCSSHMPFVGIYKAPVDLLYTPQTEEEKDNKTFAYLNSVHYTDEQIGRFLEKAKKEGLLDHTLVVIYGDHTGIHKYYPEDAKATVEAHPELSYIEAEDSPSITCIIYDPSESLPHRANDAYGGQVDIMPTVLDLLGMENGRVSFMMGRSLLSSTVDFSIMPSGTVLSHDTLPSKEKAVVLRMYQTANLLIKTNYLSENRKEKNE